MASLDMYGAYDLSLAKIDELVTKISEGNYALGVINQNTHKFVVKYVGRAEEDLNVRLKQHVGKYPKFKFSYAVSPQAAFEKVCRNFHDFGGTQKLRNTVHPKPPAHADWKCPCCGMSAD
ncbi:hypothetical protein ACH518_17220 [Methylomonas sp. HW2-6]|uniref:hypothetical protein n=1 Tax=Methylomonas sp. HW2-6 TaxID=3376687 RepID=UPI004040F7D7